MDGSSSSTKPFDGQRPLPLSLLLHLDLVVHVLGFVHHVLVKLYPLDLCLVDPIVLSMVSVEPNLGIDLGFGVENKKKLEGGDSILIRM